MKQKSVSIFAFLICGLALLFTACATAPDKISPDGKRLAALLDSMNVDKLWLPGREVHWRTGEPNLNAVLSDSRPTHCSEFAAAVAARADVYLLRPPEHSANFLASAQQDWLNGNGTNFGWRAVASPQEAQRLANAGELVMVTYKSLNPKKHGHIAIVRPSDWNDAQILSVGPEIIQAGGRNYVHASVKQGFKFHRGAFEHHQLLYFAHPISWAKND